MFYALVFPISYLAKYFWHFNEVYVCTVCMHVCVNLNMQNKTEYEN